jgi:hypothetical protein
MSLLKLKDILLNNLEFINFSTDEFSIYEWKPTRSFKSFILDLNIVKQNPVNDIFFHISRGNLKIVHIRIDDIIYTVGSTNEIQYQLLEALIEHVSSEFHKVYDVKYILSYGNFDISIFRDFNKQIEAIIKNFDQLNLVRTISVECKVCDNIKQLMVKKSFIDNADSYPVSLVYTHKGHAILCFIDKNYDVRGVELVNITG